MLSVYVFGVRRRKGDRMLLDFVISDNNLKVIFILGE